MGGLGGTYGVSGEVFMGRGGGEWGGWGGLGGHGGVGDIWGAGGAAVGEWGGLGDTYGAKYGKWGGTYGALEGQLCGVEVGMWSAVGGVHFDVSPPPHRAEPQRHFFLRSTKRARGQHVPQRRHHR